MVKVTKMCLTLTLDSRRTGPFFRFARISAAQQVLNFIPTILADLIILNIEVSTHAKEYKLFFYWEFTFTYRYLVIVDSIIVS